MADSRIEADGKRPLIKADQLIAAARQLKGIPWKHQGRTTAGVDCGGFVDLATRLAGLDLQEYLKAKAPRAYSRSESPVLHELTARYTERITKPVPGCLVLFKFDGEHYPRHYGIVTYDGYVIHANGRHGGVMEHGLRAQWSRWVHSYWKLPGVDYSDHAG